VIVNGIIDGVEVQRSQALAPVQGLDVDLRFVDVKENGENLEAAFVYEANYLKDVGFLRMTGRLLVRPPNREAREDVLKGWQQDKTIPADFAEEVTNAAHYLCTINSPFATRIVDLAPPIAPLAVSLRGKQETTSMPAQKKGKK